MMRGLVIQAAIWGMVLSGCTTWFSTPLDKPFFRLEPAESKRIPTLIRKYELVLEKCNETGSCDYAYFIRALAGLYERREVAEKYFEKTIAISPKSQLAASSKIWMELLQGHPAPASLSWVRAMVVAPGIADTNALLARTTDRLVRELLEREGVFQRVRGMKEDDDQMADTLHREFADRERKNESASKRPESTSVLSLQRQLAERERKIEDLSAQLEALKRIDQEMRDKVRPIRPPSMTAPPPAANTIQ